jgi:hypothetical protein
MKKTTIELIKLTATDGMVLTNGEAYGKEIYLGCNDSEDNWHEITEAEYEKILAEEKARMEKEMEGI